MANFFRTDSKNSAAHHLSSGPAAEGGGTRPRTFHQRIPLQPAGKTGRSVPEKERERLAGWMEPFQAIQPETGFAKSFFYFFKKRNPPRQFLPAGE
jgi:hypothetical protein